ncbi:MAG: glycosyltransferase family 39 protein [Candidatus Liptonbacteria bacterium]|nr:glycosyltransferase family 39 protein [Candidatus Liptonbacteria bacterium]
MSRVHPGWLIVSIIVLVSAGVMLGLARSDSATFDEKAHLPAGYSYVRFGDYRLNPEHPPLTKILAGLPLLALRPNFPEQDPAWTSAWNGEWQVGEQFLYHNGNDAGTLLFWGRFGPILLSLSLLFFFYFWARRLTGPWVALLPTAVLALSPVFLANGHYVTTDVAATLGFLLANFFFARFLKDPSATTIVQTGLAAGLALLAKFSTILLWPFWVLIISLAFLCDRFRPRPAVGNTGKTFLRRLTALAATLGIAYFLVVYPVYGFLVRGYPPDRQLRDTRTVLATFECHLPPLACRTARLVADTNIVLAEHSWTRPLAQYNLGVLMTLQRSVLGDTSYFRGTVSPRGSPAYFPFLFLVKEPTPILILLAASIAAALLALGRRPHRTNRPSWDCRSDQAVLFLFIPFYFWVSIRSPLNIGYRHLLPVLPSIYLCATLALRYGLDRLKNNRRGYLLGRLGAAVCLIWFGLSVALAHPFYLSYFNSLAGGTWRGYRYAVDSSYDWGQDLLRLKSWLAEHPEVDPIAVDYFGGGDPVYYLGDRAVLWRSARGDPRRAGIHWLAVSANTLAPARAEARNGYVSHPQDNYDWLAPGRTALPDAPNLPQPDWQVSPTIWVYHLP